MYGYVGKVNMDCNSPEFLIETTEESLNETEKYLAAHEGSKKVKPSWHLVLLQPAVKN